VDRDTIIAEIKRMAAENGGKPLGRERFQAETGIRNHEWMRYWARFGDALLEAGFTPNTLQRPHDEGIVIGRVAQLARELGRFPTLGDLRVKRTNDATFPGKGTFEKYGKANLVSLVATFCAANTGFDDVAAMCVVQSEPPEPEAKADTSNDGFVYMLKSGRFYKIGKTVSVGMRERQLQIQLPEQARTVHSIKTDDPDGIEAYWHERFDTKRKNGEWFELSAQDVAAFRRRKFM
jgi:Meiotically up-regulated gene 113